MLFNSHSPPLSPSSLFIVQLTLARRVGIPSARALRTIASIEHARERDSLTAKRLRTILRGRLILGMLIAVALRIVALKCLGPLGTDAAALDHLALVFAVAFVVIAERTYTASFPPPWSADASLLQLWFADFLGLDSPHNAPWSEDLRRLKRQAARSGEAADRDRRTLLRAWARARHDADRAVLRRQVERLPAFEMLGIGLPIGFTLAAFLPQVL